MDLIEALESAAIEYRNGRDEDEIWICCPFCNDQRFRLGVNIRNGRSHCFNDSCEWKSRGEYTFQKLQEALDTGEIEAKQKERKKKKRRMEKLELPEGFRILKPPSEDSYHWNKEAWSFVRKRGVTREQIRDKKIGFTTLGQFSYRAIFPVYLNGVLSGLVGRDFTDKQEPKYKNSIGSKCLYNLPEKKHSSVCLSEGVFDSLVIEQGSRKLGIDSVGLLGHSIKDDQIELLKKYKRVYLWLDPDAAGIEGITGKNGSKGIYQKLKEAEKSLRIVLPKGFLEGSDYDKRDPSELDTHEIAKRLERADSLTEDMILKLKAWGVFDE